MIPNERSRELAKRKELAFALENVTEHKDYVENKSGVVQAINQTPTRDVFACIFDEWLVRPRSMDEYVSQNEDYSRILEKVRSDQSLQNLAQYVAGVSSVETTSSEGDTRAERLMLAEMMTLLENVWISLDLEDNFLHPIHRGWLSVFKKWTGNPVFDRHWFDQESEAGIQSEFSPGFQRFIDTILRLNPKSDKQ